ncbi:protein SODIUM POTASSIUM ROOT DEFECTIVE 3-like [Rhodamnia argentea]|uniref:Protein SODIUM POTASSIUM ROOT DEFECTIVE 3-like n=1 Tax=Rhodamnia argentea TaxID=178133 RepID=A0A8B8NHW8_9MYRT|nr:protein SODIUM POTASSIUM ROOT DEFECTIVE 3-like [Rhodamnia argentea]
MKRIDISCASQASTAICSSMENKTNPSSSSSSVHCLGNRAIDRHNPIIKDARRSVRSSRPITAPCSSSHYPPINPIPYHQLHQKTKPNSLFPSKSSFDDPNKNQSRTDQTKNKKNKKRSVHSILTRSFSSKTETASTVRNNVSPKPKLGHSRTTPPGSTRYLLDSTGSTDGFSDHDPALAPAPAQTQSNNDQDQDRHHQIFASKPTSSSLSSRFKSASNQVVVLRVSLHCKGCEGKVRKHLSRMEGVSSFDIDFAAKKVTVVGDITPVGVLASVSKVKNAQFWTSSSTQ